MMDITLTLPLIFTLLDYPQWKDNQEVWDHLVCELKVAHEKYVLVHNLHIVLHRTHFTGQIKTHASLCHRNDFYLSSRISRMYVTFGDNDKIIIFTCISNLFLNAFYK